MCKFEYMIVTIEMLGFCRRHHRERLMGTRREKAIDPFVFWRRCNDANKLVQAWRTCVNLSVFVCCVSYMMSITNAYSVELCLSEKCVSMLKAKWDNIKIFTSWVKNRHKTGLIIRWTLKIMTIERGIAFTNIQNFLQIFVALVNVQKNEDKYSRNFKDVRGWPKLERRRKTTTK